MTPEDAALCERLKSSAKAFRAYPVYDSDGDPVRLIVQADESDQAAAAIERLSDSNEGLTEDLYQAVLVAYRRGAHDWARLNYPQWINAISAGQEVAPVSSTTLKGADQ